MLLSLLSKRSLDADSRDAYGFTVRPQHLHRYREYSTIYKEEEEERLHKWNCFLQQQTESTVSQENVRTVEPEVTEEQIKAFEQLTGEGNASAGAESIPDIPKEADAVKVVPAILPKESSELQNWVPVRPSLSHIEDMMSSRTKKMKSMTDEHITTDHNHLPSIIEESHSGEEPEQAYEDEYYVRKRGASTDAPRGGSAPINGVSAEPLFLWKELEFLVHGGVPRDLRGEVWQAFVGARTRRIERYYQDMLAPESATCQDEGGDKSQPVEVRKGLNEINVDVPEKLRKQIEKDLTRTFPGHPALNENGRNSLRRVLLAYARHNPSVGYCQAMNFFAGLLLLMMPEENAFWTLVGIIDDYFDGYYSQEMIESQVDQLVFEDLMRERFPKLVNHLDFLGVQVTWISGPWFLSIFVNMLPWESVLRVWDVLLFEGNRVMLFRTALALMELYGPAIVTTKDAADAISLLQSLAGSSFDSSQLVLTACMGFLNVTEDRLQGLREKHRPAIRAAVEERSKGDRVWKDHKGLATKLYSFKHNPEPLKKEPKVEESSGDKLIGGDVSHSESHADGLSGMLNGLNIDSEVEPLPDLQEQVVWMKVELCRLLEEKRTAILRSEELETALMEMVKQDNRRQLSARVEQLEREVAELQQALSDKIQQENAMIQVLMRVEQEQKVTEDARVLAEQDSAAQRYALEVLQEKYDKALGSIAEMQKRVVMAESMLEATLQYQSGQIKALTSPGSARPDSQREMPKRTGLLSFGLGWRDRNKKEVMQQGKQSDAAVAVDSQPANDGVDTSNVEIQENGHQG